MYTNMKSDFVNWIESINELSENLKGKQLDFSKKEDIDKAKKYIEEIENNELMTLLVGENLIKSIKDYIEESYAKLNKKQHPQRPSLSTSEDVKKNIAKIVQEYTNTMVFPYIKEDVNDKQKHDIVDSLYEFACWMYNR